MEDTMEKQGLAVPKTGKKMTGAQALLECLIAEDVDTIFGYPGGAIMPVYDALMDYQHELKHILTRHEQGATHAAQGYARVSNRVGVCLATSGPGATNLITGIADAQIDSTPMVCITGQVAGSLLGTDAFQETDIVGISIPVTKWNIQVTKAEDIPAAIAKAFYVARSGRPGPVLVDITKDAQFETVEFKYEKCTSLRSYRPWPVPEISAIDKAAELINKAKKPLIVFGQGVLLGRAEEELKKFIEKTGIPAASTLLGLSAVNSDHPLYVGWVGMHGNYAPNILTNECDLLIAIGMRFDDRVTGDVSRYARQAKVIHMEIDPAEIDKNVKADIPLVGNCKLSLELLYGQVENRVHKGWLKRFEDLHEQEYATVIKNDLYPDQESEITMGEVIHEVSEHSKGKAILVTDVGQHQMIAQRYYSFSEKRSNVTSGGLGTMGFALPAAFGAKLGAPGREVIAVIGDGGFQMTIQELGTIFQSQIPVKILILNNEFLGMVRQWQELFFDKRYASTELINPNFQAIAKGYEIESEKVVRRADLNEAIQRFLTHKASYILEVKVKREGNVFPMIPTGASVSEVRLK